MATQQLVISVSPASIQSAVLNSTKVKVVSNVACFYAVGINPVAYSTGNCAQLPANTVRDINVGPGTQTTSNSSAYLLDSSGNKTNVLVWSTGPITGGTGPKIAFLSASGTAGVSVTEIGFVDFNRTTN
jgi:hypothetical protein